MIGSDWSTLIHCQIVRWQLPEQSELLYWIGNHQNLSLPISSLHVLVLDDIAALRTEAADSDGNDIVRSEWESHRVSVQC